MTGVMTPLVQAAKSPWIPCRLIGIYLMGSIIGASAAVAIYSLLALPITLLVPESGRVTILITACVALAVFDKRSSMFSCLTSGRQTQPHWFRMYGPRKTFLLWGFDLGLGFTTIRVSSLYWLSFATAILLVPPPERWLVAPAYALALALGLTQGAMRSHAATEHIDVAVHDLKLHITAKRLSVSLIPILAVSLVLARAV